MKPHTALSALYLGFRIKQIIAKKPNKKKPGISQDP